METMRSNLVDVIAKVRASADSIEVASAEVAAGNTDLSQRTEQLPATCNKLPTRHKSWAAP
jgi:methyl-accepting chemotaxis protein